MDEVCITGPLSPPSPSPPALTIRPVESLCSSSSADIRFVVNSVSAAVPAPQQLGGGRGGGEGGKGHNRKGGSGEEEEEGGGGGGGGE